MNVFHRCSQHVTIVITKLDGFTWLLSGVCASMDYREWKLLWQEVTALVDQGIPIVAAGDFNCILRLEEKRGSRPFIEDLASREFGYFFQSNGLVDLRFVGPRFT